MKKHFKEVELRFDNIEKSSRAATLVRFYDRRIWVPDSLISVLDVNRGKISVPWWFVKKKELEMFVI